MKATITVTDSKGNVFEGAAVLSPIQGSDRRIKTDRPKVKVGLGQELDFSASLPHFIRMHGKGMSGPKKFTLLLAYLAKGALDEGASVNDKELKRIWNKMTRIMGISYNRSYASRARDYGWADSPKHGQHKLSKGWVGILAN